MIFNVVILSPHGYFGQSNVLGLPDTGGQIVAQCPLITDVQTMPPIVPIGTVELFVIHINDDERLCI